MTLVEEIEAKPDLTATVPLIAEPAAIDPSAMTTHAVGAAAEIATRIVVNAHGTPAGGVFPHFRVLVDGVPVGDATANQFESTPYIFNVAVAPDQAHRVQIH